MNLRIKIKNIDAKLNSILESVFNYFPNLIPSSILDLLASVLPPPFDPPRFAQVTTLEKSFTQMTRLTFTKLTTLGRKF